MAAVRNRGQLILVGGISLALVLVAIVLVLNSAIYSENLASRSSTDDMDGALERQADVRASVGRLLVDQPAADLNDEVDAVGAEIENQSARGGAVVSVEHTGQTPGTRLERAGLTSVDDGTGNWTVADDVRVRNFSVELDAATFDAATFDVTGDGDSWQVQLAETGGDVSVTVDGSTMSGTCVSAPSDGTVTVDFSDGTVGGKTCPALVPVFHEATKYRVELLGGDADDGSVSLVVANSTSVQSNYDTVEPVTYSVDVQFVYQTNDLYYETTLEVTPGETDA